MKKVCSIRLEDEVKQDLKKRFGNLQHGVDTAIEELDNKYIYVYLIANIDTGEHYVGQSNNPMLRFKAHTKNKKTKIGSAILDHGEDRFSFSLLAKTTSRKIALEMESFFIVKYDSIKNGYNEVAGKPRISKNVRLVKSVRIDPADLKKIIKKYGSLTVFLNEAIKEYIYKK